MLSERRSAVIEKVYVSQLGCGYRIVQEVSKLSQEARLNSVSMSRDEIASIVVSCVCEFFFVQAAHVTDTTRFEDDLSADAFAFADCIDALEEEFTEHGYAFHLEAKERDELETVGELIDAISTYVFLPRSAAVGNREHA